MKVAGFHHFFVEGLVICNTITWSSATQSIYLGISDKISWSLGVEGSALREIGCRATHPQD